MKRPYDLMAFLEQEKRVEKLENLKTLLSDTSSLDNVADRHEPDLEEKFYNNDIDCQNAGQPLTEFDLFTSTLIHPDPSVIPEVVRILRDEYADLEKSELTQPLCGKVKPFLTPKRFLMKDVSFSRMIKLKQIRLISIDTLLRCTIYEAQYLATTCVYR